MIRAFSAVALLLICPALCHAAEPKKPAEPTEQIIKMSLQPMAAPVPALKYQLLPTLEETNPGNPVQGYLKCFMEEGKWFYDPKIADERDRWETIPLKELPVQRILDEASRSMFHNIDYAARLDTPDWQCLLNLKSAGPELLLPDVQAMRALARTVLVRFRAQVALRKFDDAIASAKTMFAMSRHVFVHPTLVGELIGVSVLNSMTLPTLEEMIQQPGCPNLYWALSALPTPLVNLDRALQGEELLYAGFFAPFDGHSPMSEAELQASVDRLDDSIKWFASGSAPAPKKGDVRKLLEAKSKDASRVEAARRRLAAAGYEEKLLSKFLPLQVIMADEILAVIERREDNAKAMELPYWQMREVVAASEKKWSGAGDRGSTMAPFVFISMTVARRRQVRAEQRIAILRCLEALRLYAADHDGQLPARLDDTQVPTPLDPVSGKPFSYRLDGLAARIHGEPLAKPGEEGFQPNRVYRVTVRE